MLTPLQRPESFEKFLASTLWSTEGGIPFQCGAKADPYIPTSSCWPGPRWLRVFPKPNAALTCRWIAERGTSGAIHRSDAAALFAGTYLSAASLLANLGLPGVVF